MVSASLYSLAPLLPSLNLSFVITVLVIRECFKYFKASYIKIYENYPVKMQTLRPIIAMMKTIWYLPSCL